jgi:hypothetical protein
MISSLVRAKGGGHGATVRNELTPAVSLLALALLASAACRQDMHDAPRYDPLEASPVFAGGASAQPLVAGTVPRGRLAADDLMETGRLNGQSSPVFPFEITRADLDRGEERYNIYCSPCHDRNGDGSGMVVQRGYKQPTSYHTDRLRQAPPGYFFEVMTNGFATMPDYRAQIPAVDRWRIAAYIRVLQLSQNATAADAPVEELQKLNAAPAVAAPPAGGQ